MSPQLRVSLSRFLTVAGAVMVLTAVLSGLKEWDAHHNLTSTAIAVVTELITLLTAGSIIGINDATRANAVRSGDISQLKESDVGSEAAARHLQTGS